MGKSCETTEALRLAQSTVGQVPEGRRERGESEGTQTRANRGGEGDVLEKGKGEID